MVSLAHRALTAIDLAVAVPGDEIDGDAADPGLSFIARAIAVDVFKYVVADKGPTCIVVADDAIGTGVVRVDGCAGGGGQPNLEYLVVLWNVLSASTRTVMVLTSSLAAKVTVPEGNPAPMKSSASA